MQSGTLLHTSETTNVRHPSDIRRRADSRHRPLGHAPAGCREPAGRRGKYLMAHVGHLAPAEPWNLAGFSRVFSIPVALPWLSARVPRRLGLMVDRWPKVTHS